MNVQAKPHRLPPERYVGRIAVAFTACLRNRRCYFVDEASVAVHRQILQAEVEAAHCVAYAYCFMPDHFHLVLLGLRQDSAPLLAMTRFKQKSGFRLRDCDVAWQPSFYDHILRPGADTVRQALYVLNNPVRAGLAANMSAYPFSGLIGISMSDLLVSVIDL
jgi:putative transposase